MSLSASPTVKILTRSGKEDKKTALDITLEAFSDANCSSTALSTLQADSLIATTSQGSASFGNLSLSGASETVWFRARSVTGLLQTECSGPISVIPGTGARLEFSAEPSSEALLDAPLESQPSVTALDACGNTMSIDPINIRLDSYTDAACSTASPAGNLTATSLELESLFGFAQFSGVTFENAGNFHIGASASGYQSACAPVQVTAPALAAALDLHQTGSSSADSCIPLAASPVIKILDSAGRLDTTSAVPITLEAFSDSTCSTPADATLAADALSVTTSAGYATFSNVALSGALGSFYLRGKNTALALQSPCFGPIQINRGSGATLAYSTAPSSTGIATSLLASQPIVAPRDSCGNPFLFESVSVALDAYTDPVCATPATAGTLSVSSNPITSSFGASVFTGVQFESSGAYFLGATATGYQSACTPVTLSAPVPASAIAFHTEPSTSADSCVALTTQPVVKVLDSLGRLDNASNITLTLEAFSNSSCTTPSAAALTATQLSIPTHAGYATFANVKLTGSLGNAYLRARNSDGSLTTSCFGPIAVQKGSGARLDFSSAPSSSGYTSVVLGAQPVVSLLDACNTVLTSETSSIALGAYTDSSCSSAAAAGTLTASSNPLNATAGAANFSNVTFTSAGSYYIGATGSGYQSACNAISITTPTPGAALAFHSAGSATADSCVPLVSQPIVKVLDSIGGVDTTTPMDITLEAFTDSSCTTSASGNLSASALTVTSSSGYANFSGVTLSGSLGNFYIKARDASGTIQTQCTGPIVVARGSGARVAFTAGPSANATAGIYLGTQPDVSLLDACTNVLVSETTSINLSVYDDLSCNTSSTVGTMTLSNSNVAATLGTAAFSSVKLFRSGVFYLGATAPGYQSACTPVTVASNSAYRISVSTAGSTSGTAGTNLAQVPVFEIQDAYSNRITSSSAVVALASFSDAACSLAYGGTLSPSSVTAASGLATPGSVSQTKSGTLYIRGSSSGLQSVCHGPITLAPDTPTKLIFVTQPSFTANPAKNFTTQPVVAVADANDNIVPTATPVDITLAAMTDAACTTAAGAALTVPTNPTPTQASGVASFAGVQYPDVLSTLRIRATASGLTAACSSSDTNVAAGTATQLVFTQPAGTQSRTAGTNFTTQPVVRARDADGNLASAYTGTVTIAAYTDSACTLAATPDLTGTKARAAVAGVATFTGMSYSKAGTIYIKATAPNLTSACSPAHTITAGSASRLAFTTQPSSTGVAGNPLINQPVVEVQDAQGNRITGATDTITLTAFTNNTCTTASTGTFSSTPTAAIDGSAIFSEVKHTKAETIYIKASSGTLATACSSGVVVAVGPASRLAFSTQPTPNSTAICTDYTNQPVVRIEDAYGNLVNTASDSISLDVYKNATCTTPAEVGSVVNATANPRNAAAGIASFTGVDLNLRGMTSGSAVVYIRASSGSLDSACSNALTTTSAPTALAVLAQPASGVAGAVLSPNFQVEVRDSCGQKIDYGSYSISIGLSSDSACTTRPPWNLNASATTLNTTGQRATFNNISIPVSGVQYLRTTLSGTNGVCVPVNLSPGTTSKLTFLTQPIQSPINAPFAPTFSIGITDSLGNVTPGITESVTLTPYSDSNCSVAVPDSSVIIAPNGLTASTSDSIVHFPGLRVTAEGRYYFKASSSSYGSTCSDPVDIFASGQIIASSDYSACVLTGGGATACWGNSTPSTARAGVSIDVSVPQRARGSAPSWKMAVGYATQCWLRTSGHVECNGNGTMATNTSGTLGNGIEQNVMNPVRVKESDGSTDLSNVIDLSGSALNATNGSMFCAVKSDGTVWCWGGGVVGTGVAGGLGNGTTGNSNLAVQVSNLSDALSVTAGDRFACAIRRTGTISCWGRNPNGNLGNTLAVDSAIPASVPGFDRVNAIGITRYSTCALRNGGELWCWGDGAYGGTALSTSNDYYSPRNTNFPTKFRTLAGNHYKTHMCGALIDGTVRCWGGNNDHMIGNSNLETYIYTPTEPFPGELTNTRSVASNIISAYSVSEDGSAYFWGRSGSLNMGVGMMAFYSRPTDASLYNSETGIVDLSVQPTSSGKHTCFRHSDGRLQCTGGDQFGAAGYGTPGPPHMTPATILSDATSVTTSAGQTCATRSNGTVQCWGLNSTTSSPTVKGLIDGNNSSTTALINTPTTINITGLPAFASEVVASDRTVCVRTPETPADASDGKIYCWGDNLSGQLGSTASGVATFDSSRAYEITGITNATKLVALSVTLSAGLRSTFCALLRSGEVHCWGDGGYGMLGRNDGVQSVSVPTASPAAVAGISDAVDIKAGWGNVCVRLSTAVGGATGGNIKCWGAGTTYQLGNGGAVNTSNPVIVNLGGNVAIDLATAYRTGCALLGPAGTGTTVRCWGEGANGSTGQGSISSNIITPADVKGVTGYDQIFALGLGFAVRRYGTSGASDSWLVWGQNYPNQLRLSEINYSTLSPWLIQLPPRMSAGANHTCRVRLDGRVECWGSNTVGQLGVGSSPASSSTPLVVNGISNAYTIAAGGNHTCAIVADGNVYCWGRDGVGLDSSTPQIVPWDNSNFSSSPQASRIGAGENHTCMIYGYGNAATPTSAYYRSRCWGKNDSGQLGTNNTTNLTAPTKDVDDSTSATNNQTTLALTTLSMLEGVTAGSNHTCLLIRGGGARCFGENGLYQLNIGNTTNSSWLKDPFTYRPYSWVAAGGDHTCAVLSDFSGRVGCFGSNASGEFGDGTQQGSSATKIHAYATSISNADFGILAAGKNHTCTGLKDGAVKCWGLGASGQLGQGSNDSSLTPISPSGVSGAVREITAGDSHTCIRTTSTIQCFGLGIHGQLGQGSANSSSTPVQVQITVR